MLIWDWLFTVCFLALLLTSYPLLMTAGAILLLAFFVAGHRPGQWGDWVTLLRVGLAFLATLFLDYSLMLLSAAFLLDGVDGYVARRTQKSRFGEHFDMQSDIYLSYILTVFCIQNWGFWVASMVLLRPVYLILAGALGIKEDCQVHRRSSRLGKTAAVVSTATLLVGSFTTESFFVPIYLFGFGLLLYSFSFDYAQINWRGVKQTNESMG